LASDTILTTLHPLLENVLHTICRKLQEDSGTGGFDPEVLFIVGKGQKSHGTMYGLYGGCSNGGSTDLGERIHCRFSIAQR
jgi:hypothetical protein